MNNKNNKNTFTKETSKKMNNNDSKSIIQYSIGDNSRFNLLKNVLNKTTNAIVDKPFSTNYSTEQSRLDSYLNWPNNLKQKPIDLAKAGFYYYGQKDIVKCFFCNGSLADWEINDIPVEEHARWFPKCSYLRQLMGINFLEEMREKYKNIDSGFTNEFTYEMTQYYHSSFFDQINNEEKISTQTPTTNKIIIKREREISPTIISSRIDLPGVRKIINLGLFKISIVKRAIENKFKKDNDDFKNLIDLVNSCFNIIENDKKIEQQIQKLFHLIILNVSNQFNKSDILSLLLFKFNIKPLIIRLFPANDLTNLVLIRLNDDDKDKCDLIINQLNDKKFPLNNKINLDLKLIVKKIFNNNSIDDDILEKFYDKKKFLDDLECFINNQSKIYNKIKFDSKFNYKKSIEQQQQLQDETSSSGSSKALQDLNQNNLVEEVERLNKERLCVICLDRLKNIMFLPCAHLASCVECSVAMVNCPVCRTKVEATIRTYC